MFERWKKYINYMGRVLLSVNRGVNYSYHANLGICLGCLLKIGILIRQEYVHNY